MEKRDYSLTGSEAAQAVESGLTTAAWYHTDIPRAEMKALMVRRDGPALRDTALLLALMLGFAGAGVVLWPSWWSAPFWLAYGVLYGSASDSRWHECGHRTAFKTRWMNDVVYHVASFMIVRNPVTWRRSHTRHHTDTIIVGRDPEIVAMRPPAAARIAANFFGILDAWNGWARMLLNAAGQLTAEEETFVPEVDRPRVIRMARVWVAIYVTVIASALAMGSILPLIVIGLPRLYGAWHHVLTGLLQHGGLAEDVRDYRLNTRTVLMNPVSRFIYWNMNYHVEHHMFPMVPYHRLPDLHAAIAHDLPPPSRSILAGYREMLPILWRQLQGEDVWLKRTLPAGAQPYREDTPRRTPDTPSAGQILPAS